VQAAIETTTAVAARPANRRLVMLVRMVIGVPSCVVV
jgi:hypothetical protein